MGGFGGDASKASKVDVTNSGAISTVFDESHAIFAQSIGGSGGAGGSSLNAIALFAQNQGTAAINIAMGMGGFGGSGAVGGPVSVTNSAMLETSGAGSHGIYAQSIGGGEGSGGSLRNFSLTSDGTSFGRNEMSVSVRLGIGGFGGSANHGGG